MSTSPGCSGLRRAVVAVSKTDLVGPDAGGRVAGGGDAALLRARRDRGRLPPVLTSALRGQGIDGAARGAGAALAAGRRRARRMGVAFLPIDRAFSVAGHGTVVTGTLRGARAGAGRRAGAAAGGGGRGAGAGVQVHGSAGGARRAGSARGGQSARRRARRGRRAARRSPRPGTLPPSAWLTRRSCARSPDAPPLRDRDAVARAARHGGARRAAAPAGP